MLVITLCRPSQRSVLLLRPLALTGCSRLAVDESGGHSVRPARRESSARAGVSRRGPSAASRNSHTRSAGLAQPLRTEPAAPGGHPPPATHGAVSERCPAPSRCREIPRQAGGPPLPSLPAPGQAARLVSAASRCA